MAVKAYPGKFNPQTGAWTTDSGAGANVNISELTLVTFNVWFDDYYALERCEAFRIILGW